MSNFSSPICLAHSNALELLSYNRKDVQIGVVHIGVGNFHRAHQALYIDEVLASGDLRWGISGIGLLPADKSLIKKLQQQQGLYTLVERSGDSQTARIIGSIVELIAGYDHPESVLNRLTNEVTKIVTLTITERGYCHDPATKQLDFSRPEIIHDLANPTQPKSACGFVVEALNIRMQRGLNPFVVMSCDNIPSNGDVVRNVVIELAKHRSDILAAWINEHCAFPCSMVDRITPATRPEASRWVEEQFGITDQAPVICEPFRQWVIEKKFCGEMPTLDDFGVKLVDDVRPYELAKIRLLNVSHSALAYPALVDDLTFVHEAAGDRTLRSYLTTMMEEEVIPTLPLISGYDFNQYFGTIIDRFSNTAIEDRLERICSDGSQKLANQVFPIIQERIESGKPYKRLAFLTAAWLRYLAGRTDRDQAYQVIDPLRDKLAPIAASAVDSAEPYLRNSDIFPSELVSNAQFESEVSGWLRIIYSEGIRTAIMLLD